MHRNYIGQTKQLKINWTELIGNFIVFVLLLFVQIRRTRSSRQKNIEIFLFRKYEPFYGSHLKCDFMCWALKLEQAVSNDRVWSFDFIESIFANIQDFGSIERFNVWLKSAQFASLNVFYLLN